MQEGETSKKVADRLMAFKTELTKDIASLDAEKVVKAGQGSLGKVAQH